MPSMMVMTVSRPLDCSPHHTENIDLVNLSLPLNENIYQQKYKQGIILKLQLT